MQVEVLGSENIAPDSILMIRAGAMRRQTKLSAGQPFQFPSLPVNSNPFKIELYQSLGSQSITLSQHAKEYEIKLPGEQPGSPDSVIKLEVIDRAPGGERVAEIEDSELNKKKVEDEAKKDEASKDARLYLQNHGLVGFVQKMLGDVLKAKPHDPFAFMAGIASGVEDSGAETNKAPTAKCPVENFGDDEDACQGPDTGQKIAVPETQAAVADREDIWVVDSQRALKLSTGEFAILTTWVNHGNKELRFEAKGLEVTITEAAFEELCAKMGVNLPSRAQAVDAALNALLDGKRQRPADSAGNPEECTPSQNAIEEQQDVGQATLGVKEKLATDPAADRLIAAAPEAEHHGNRMNTKKDTAARRGG
jgi:hypothetical protein